MPRTLPTFYVGVRDLELEGMDVGRLLGFAALPAGLK